MKGTARRDAYTSSAHAIGKLLHSKCHSVVQHTPSIHCSNADPSTTFWLAICCVILDHMPFCIKEQSRCQQSWFRWLRCLAMAHLESGRFVASPPQRFGQVLRCNPFSSQLEGHLYRSFWDLAVDQLSSHLHDFTIA